MRKCVAKCRYAGRCFTSCSTGLFATEFLVRNHISEPFTERRKEGGCLFSSFLFRVSCWSRFTSLAIASPQLQGCIIQPLGEYSGVQIQWSAVWHFIPTWKEKGVREDKVQHAWCGLQSTGRAKPGLQQGTSSGRV